MGSIGNVCCCTRSRASSKVRRNVVIERAEQKGGGVRAQLTGTAATPFATAIFRGRMPQVTRRAAVQTNGKTESRFAEEAVEPRGARLP